MPASITNLISNLPTREERIIGKQLWNPSLPVSANVGIIEYNRVDGVKFKEKVDEKYGEDWSRRLEDLARELNEAARVVVGKGRGIAVVQGKGNGGKGVALDEGSRKGKAPEKKAIELPKGQGGEFKNKYINETEGKDQEVHVKTLAEAATLVANTGDGSYTKIAEFTTEGEEAKPNSDEKATEATMSLSSPSSTPADTLTAEPSAEPSALAATNPLSALWYLIDRFFSSGPSAASYFFVALEAAIRLDTTTVHPLNIPAPPAFWTDAVPWDMPKVGLTLILTLASSSNNKFDAFARFSKSLGKPPSSVSEMRTKPSASLRKAVLRAKDDAARKARTTILGVDLRDVFYSQLCEVHGRDIEQHFATFGRMFALGISPGGGAKLWLVGGEWGETGTVWEGNRKVGAAVGTWEEMDEFVRAFEGFAVADVGFTFSFSPSFLILFPSPPLSSLPHPSHLPNKSKQRNPLTDHPSLSPTNRANGTPNASNGTTAASPSTSNNSTCRSTTRKSRSGACRPRKKVRRGC